MELIDKSAVVAEIEKRIKETESMQPKFDQFWAGQISAFKGVLKLLDTLEVKDLPIWERVSPDTGQTTLYKDGCKSYLERFGYRIDLKDLDKLPKKNLKAQKGE